MATRQSGIRPPTNLSPAKIPVPVGSVTGAGTVAASGLPRPSGLPTMKSNTNPSTPYDSPVHTRPPGTPPSSIGSHKEVLTEDTDSFIIGDVVWVGGAKRGKIAYIGEVQFSKGEWAGVALDAPLGKHDGMVQGIRYFQCDPMHGTFARLYRLTRRPLPPYDNDDCFLHGQTPPRCLADYRRSPSPFRSKSPSPGPMTPTRLGSPPPAAKIGDRVIVQSSSGTKRGLLRFIGTTVFAPGEWAGIELDQPIGKNDGSVAGHRYFTCPDKYGLFAPVYKVSSSPANRLTTPTLRRHGSRESMLSNMSSIASSSAPRAMRRALVSARTGTHCLPTCALQAVLQEKEKHLEQLLTERDLDKNEAAQANRNYEERIQEYLGIQQMLVKQQEDWMEEKAQLVEKVEELEEESKSLRIALEEARKEHEDLLFTYEEEKINQADSLARLCGTEENADTAPLKHLIQQYSEKLKHREMEIGKLNERLAKQQKELDAARAREQEKENTIKKLESQVDGNQQQIRQMEESLAAEIVHSQHAIATLEKAHARKLEDVTNFGQRVQELSSSLIKTMAEYEELKDEKLKLEKDLTEMMLKKSVEPVELESRLRSRDEESAKLQQHVQELQQLNSSLTSIWEYNLKVIEDNYKAKEADLIQRNKELEEKLRDQSLSTEKTISNLQLQLGLKQNQ